MGIASVDITDRRPLVGGGELSLSLVRVTPVVIRDQVVSVRYFPRPHGAVVVGPADRVDDISPVGAG